MKKALLLAICLMLAASMAFAQAGNLGVFADPAGLSCTLTMATTTVYVVHINTANATACQFALAAPMGLMHIATVAGTGHLVLGDAVNGAGVSYGICKSGPIYAAMVIYTATTGPMPCDLITVVADPSGNPPGIYMADCTTPNPVQFEITTGGSAIFSDGTCPCDVPVEDTSWGKIKSLYQ
ncbi:MAG: hypothetical protein ACYSUX_18745 [Planctomycetota bacterium]